MTVRLLSVLTALAVLIGVPVAGLRLAQHRRPAAASTAGALPAEPSPSPQVTRYPAGYVGVVSDNVAKFDASCGCHPNAAIHYIKMGGPVSVSLARLALAQGAVPLLELEPYGMAMSQIAAGSQDAWLTRYAKAVAGLKAPVIMSFAPEANGDWYNWGFQSTRAANYVKAWQHVVSVFRKAGAASIKWIWIVNRAFPQAEAFAKLWPGAGYADMVGIDGYFTSPQDTFATVFGPTIADVRKLTSEPVLITETAAGPAAGKLRAVQELTAALGSYHLAGFLWFDVAQQGDTMHEDWRIEDNAQAVTAYRGAVQQFATPVR